MLIPLIIIGVGAISLLPTLIGKVHLSAIAYESCQVALDNAAVVAGRRWRSVLNELVRANQRLASLEALHHSSHACALVPGPQQPACQAQDRAQEVAIEGFIGRQMVWSVEEWQRANAELAAHAKVTPASGMAIPWSRSPCLVCGRDFNLVTSPRVWEVEAYPPDGRCESIKIQLQGSGFHAPWIYRLRSGGGRVD